MPPLVVPNCLQVTINGTQADGPFATVLHFDVTEADPYIPFLLATTALDAYIDEILPVLCNSVSVQSARYVDLSTEDGVTGVVAPTTEQPLAGSVTAQACPPQVAYLVSLIVNSTRGVRNGRMYLPGVRFDEVNDDGNIGSETVDDVTAAVTAFHDTFVGDPPALNWSVLHRPAEGDPYNDEIFLQLCQPTVATQRRRLRR